MKINELVAMYEKNPRIDIAKVVETRPYVGIEYKRHLAELVLDNCTSVVDGEIHIDSVERYILFTIAVIGIHTNLEFSTDEDSAVGSIDDYDELCRTGLLTKVIDTFKEDYLACQEILNMMTADLLQNHITIEKKIHQFIDSIQEILSGAVASAIDKLDIDGLDGFSMDQEKLMSIYNLFKNK